MITHVAVALLLPWLCGAAWLHSFWRARPAGSTALIVGYGWFVGLLVTTLLMRLWDAAGLPQDFYLLSLLLALFALLGLARGRRWRRARSGHCDGYDGSGEPWRKIVLAFLVGILLLRFADLAMEVVLRPMYPWDAWMHWAPKAKVWEGLRELVPFVSPAEWLATAGESGYTSTNWHYPATIPLTQLWVALALGRWDEALVNLPWVLCALALGFAFYGQARIWGTNSLTAAIFVYFLLSMPLLDAHVALAGYADIWMAAVYGLAFMAFIQWLRIRDARQGLLAVVFILACPLVKNPGWVWALTFLPALAVALLPKRALFVVILCVGSVLVAIALSGGYKVSIPGVGPFAISLHGLELPYVGRYRFELHPVWNALFEQQFALGSWHLFWYLFWGITALGLPEILRVPWIRAAAMQVLVGLGFLSVVFFMTPYYRYVVNATGVNRALFHMVPALLFFALVVFCGLFSERHEPSQEELQAPKSCP